MLVISTLQARGTCGDTWQPVIKTQLLTFLIISLSRTSERGETGSAAAQVQTLSYKTQGALSRSCTPNPPSRAEYAGLYILFKMELLPLLQLEA